MNPMALAEHGTRTALSVNLNKVALLRNSRELNLPSVTHAATQVLLAGADGITVHPRPDQRHIRTHDVHELAALMKDWPQAEYNIEGNPLHNLLDFAESTRPHQMTFVPDTVGQSTSDHGWDLSSTTTEHAQVLRPLIARAQAAGARVSLFLDPIPEYMALAKELGADRVELYTEAYARAYAKAFAAPSTATLSQTGATKDAANVEESTAAHTAFEVCQARYVAAATAAQAAGLEINAGHDLNLHNLRPFLQAVQAAGAFVREVSIGHALMADALDMGYAQTIRAYLACVTLKK